MKETIRINKYIASAGVCSRRKADELIRAGRVSVDGVVVRDFGIQVSAENAVEVDGREIRVDGVPPIYLMLHKPVGFLTTVQDDRGRPTVMELLGDMEERLFPVGRLDYQTSGLLILTNDGDFANQMAHPANKIYKTYRARVKGVVTHTKANILRRGVIVDGVRTAPALVEIERQGNRSTVLEIKIYEGKNRQVRKMCAAIGHPVLELERVAIGNLTLGHLKEGHYKKINPSDIAALIHLAQKSGASQEKKRKTQSVSGKRKSKEK